MGDSDISVDLRAVSTRRWAWNGGLDRTKIVRGLRAARSGPAAWAMGSGFSPESLAGNCSNALDRTEFIAHRAGRRYPALPALSSTFSHAP